MKSRAFIMIIIAGILWGTSSLFVHFLAPFGFSSLQMTFSRATVTVLAMGIYVFFLDKKLFQVTPKELILLFFSGLSFFLTASCYYFSMQATSVSTAVILMYIAPVIVMVYSVIFFGEKLTKIKVISVVSMLLGCCLVSGIIGGLKFNFLGIIVGVISGLSYSAYNILTKIEMRCKIHPTTATFYTFLFATAISLITANPSNYVSIISLNPPIIFALIALGVCTCVLPYFLYTTSLKYLPVGTAAALGIVEPMAATTFSIIFLNEKLDLLTLLGIVLILGAVFLLSRTKE